MMNRMNIVVTRNGRRTTHHNVQMRYQHGMYVFEDITGDAVCMLDGVDSNLTAFQAGRPVEVNADSYVEKA